MENELLSCARCGGKDPLYYSREKDGAVVHYFLCTCEWHISKYGSSREEAIDNWNDKQKAWSIRKAAQGEQKK